MIKSVIGLTFFCFSIAITYGQIGSTNIDSLIRALGANFIKNQQAVGLSIGIYDKGNTHFYNFGTTELGKEQLPTRNTVYEIGSITKTLVSYILANAVLEGKLNLDDDIRKYLKDEYPNLEYRGNPIKLVHLANTTSLLPDWLPELPVEYKTMFADSALTLKIKRYGKLTRKDFFTALHTVTPDTIPGTRSYHSNAAAQLLAYILEDVYKTPLDQLVHKYITAPHNLPNTSFIKARNLEQVATGYTASNKIAAYESVMPYFEYAGGLGSTASDMANYMKLLLDTTNKAAALCLKKTVDIDASTGRVTSMRPENIAAPEVYSAALNWFKYQPDVSSLQIWSDGGTNGFNSYLVIYPHFKTGIIILANKSAEKIFRALPGMAYEISKVIGPK